MRPPTVLLVEDEPVIALDLQVELEQAGCKVMMASDTQTALQLCSHILPDVAIINFHYKNSVDGMALARQLRTQFLTKVFFITGARQQNIKASGNFYAGHEVLHKPFTRRQLQRFLFAEKNSLEA